MLQRNVSSHPNSSNRSVHALNISPILAHKPTTFCFHREIWPCSPTSSVAGEVPWRLFSPRLATGNRHLKTLHANHESQQHPQQNSTSKKTMASIDMINKSMSNKTYTKSRSIRFWGSARWSMYDLLHWVQHRSDPLLCKCWCDPQRKHISSWQAGQMTWSHPLVLFSGTEQWEHGFIERVDRYCCKSSSLTSLASTSSFEFGAVVAWSVTSSWSVRWQTGQIAMLVSFSSAHIRPERHLGQHCKSRLLCKQRLYLFQNLSFFLILVFSSSELWLLWSEKRISWTSWSFSNVRHIIAIP
jgi:hypothetical protein